jgi:hypothetical protein
MSTVDRTIAIASAEERLRQERETFDQRKLHTDRAFRLRQSMGYVVVVLLPALCVLCAYVLLNHKTFSRDVQAAAAATLFVDAVGLVLGIYRVTLSEPVHPLEPVTPAATDL